MPKHLVMNIPKVPISKTGLQMVIPPELSYKIEVDLDKKVIDEMKKDPLLQQEFQAQASEILDQTKKTIEQKCKVFDKLFVGMVNKGASEKDMKKQLDGLNQAIENDMKVAKTAAEIAVKAVWKKLQKDRKDWTKFKIKVFASITGTLAGLAVSIAAMATSPFSGGAGAALGIIGLIKSGVSLAEDIRKIAMNIGQSRTVLVKHLQFVEAAAKKKGLYASNEVGAAVLNEFLGVAQPSLKSVETESDTLKAKYAQMIVKVHDLSKKLNKILAEQEKLKKEFLTEAAKKLKKHPVKDKGGQLKMISKGLDGALAPSHKLVDGQIKKVMVMYGDTRKWAAEIKDLMKRVEQLQINDPAGLKVFREALKLAAVPLAIIDGNSIATSAKDLGMGLGGAIGGYAYDKITSKALDGTVFDAA